MDTMVERGSSSDKESFDVGLVLTRQIPLIWPRVEQLLIEKRPEWMDKFGLLDVLENLAKGDWELWAGFDDGEMDGFTLCYWFNYPKRREYHVVGVVGQKLRKYIHMLKKIERYAAMGGASEVVIDARYDMHRLFTRMGYGPVSTQMKKDIRVMWS